MFDKPNFIKNFEYSEPIPNYLILGKGFWLESKSRHLNRIVSRYPLARLYTVLDNTNYYGSGQCDH